VKLDYVRNEIPRMRGRIRAQEREVTMLQRAGVSTASAELLLCFRACGRKSTTSAANAKCCASGRHRPLQVLGFRVLSSGTFSTNSEGKGNGAGERRHYEMFVDIWTSRDPGWLALPWGIDPVGQIEHDLGRRAGHQDRWWGRAEMHAADRVLDRHHRSSPRCPRQYCAISRVSMSLIICTGGAERPFLQDRHFRRL
jgi:hypothetical protein